MKIKTLVLTACCIEGATIILWLIFPDRFAGAPLWIPDLLVRAFFATFTGTLAGISCLLQGDMFGSCYIFHKEKWLLLGVLISAVFFLILRKHRRIIYFPRLLVGKLAYALYYIFTPHPAAKVVRHSKGEVSDHITLADALSLPNLHEAVAPPSRLRSHVLRRKAEALAELLKRRRADQDLLNEHEDFVRREHRCKKREQ